MKRRHVLPALLGLPIAPVAAANAGESESDEDKLRRIIREELSQAHAEIRVFQFDLDGEPELVKLPIRPGARE